MQESAVDITEKFIKDRLDPALVTELVMRSLPKLPYEIPAHFSSSYTPIDAAGTEGQIKVCIFRRLCKKPVKVVVHKVAVV